MPEQFNNAPLPPAGPSPAEWSPTTYHATGEGISGSIAGHVSEYDQNMLVTALHEAADSDDSEVQKSSETEILANGTLHGQEVGMAEVYRDANQVARDRLWMANLVHTAPEIADILAEREIVGFHATGSFALASLVESGSLLSGRQLAETGRASITGAHDAHSAGQSSISFGQLSETQHNIEQYGGQDLKLSSEEVVANLTYEVMDSAKMAEEFPVGSKLNVSMRRLSENFRQALTDFQANPDSLAATMMRNKFPVAVGITRGFVRQAEAERQKGNLKIGQSYYGEFRPAAEVIPIEALPVVVVPADKVEPVRQLLAMFKHDQVAVIPIEAMKF